MYGINKLVTLFVVFCVCLSHAKTIHERPIKCSAKNLEIMRLIPTEIMNCDHIRYGTKTTIVIKKMNMEWLESPAVSLIHKVNTCKFSNAIINYGYQKTHRYVHESLGLLTAYNKTLKQDDKPFEKYRDNTYVLGEDIYDCTGWSLFGTTVKENNFYVLQKGTIYYKPSNKDMVCTVGSVNGANYAEQSYFDGEKTIMWNINENYKQVYTYDQTVMAIKLVDINGNYHYKIPNEYATFVVNASQLNRDVDGYYDTSSPLYKIKEVSATTKLDVQDKTPKCEAEIQYARDELQIVYRNTETLCEAINTNFRSIMNLCTGDATACAKVLLNNSNVEAKKQGNVLIIKLCTPVDIIEYKPMKTDDNRCYVYIPVTYVIDGTSVNGFYNPIHNKIYDESPLSTDCNKEYIVVDDGKHKLYNSSGNLKDIQISPLNNENIPKIDKSNTVDKVANPTILEMLISGYEEETTKYLCARSADDGSGIIHIVLTATLTILLIISVATNILQQVVKRRNTYGTIDSSDLS